MSAAARHGSGPLVPRDPLPWAAAGRAAAAGSERRRLAAPVSRVSAGRRASCRPVPARPAASSARWRPSSSARVGPPHVRTARNRGAFLTGGRRAGGPTGRWATGRHRLVRALRGGGAAGGPGPAVSGGALFRVPPDPSRATSGRLLIVRR